MLIFASVAALFATPGVGVVGIGSPTPPTEPQSPSWLAQPLFTLHLAHHIRPVPRVIRVAALVAFLLTTVPLVGLPLRAIGVLFLPAVVVFVGIHLVAAIPLAHEAARRVGSARVRLGSASAAGLAMAMALALSVIGSRIPILPDIGRILALGAATPYMLAFMPPAWVRKVWNAVMTSRIHACPGRHRCTR